MTPKLDPLREVLRVPSDEALSALRHAAIGTRHLAPSFTAWTKHMVDWELDRRAGAHYFLLFPEELVHPSEFARGAKRTLAEIAARLAPDAFEGMDELLDELGELVSRGERH